MSLKTDLNSLLREHNSPDGISSNHLRQRSAGVIKRKIERIRRRLTTAGFNIHLPPWDTILLNNETYFFSVFGSSNVELQTLCRREIDMEFFYISLNSLTNPKRLYSENTNRWLECFSYNRRLLYKDDNNAIRSWSYITSLSNRNLSSKSARPYTKHLYRKSMKNLKSSMYAKDVTPSRLESLAVEKGIGVIKSPSLAYFYARFDQCIGYLPGNSGSSDIIKVQIDRRIRPKRLIAGRKHKQGVFYFMHGYPISDSELQNDTRMLYGIIKKNLISGP